jgi:hypothetical protein
VASPKTVTVQKVGFEDICRKQVNRKGTPRSDLLEARFWIVVPVPDKIRMPLSRVLASGAVVAELSGFFFKEFDKLIILNVAYKLGARYREEAFSFGLTKDGLTALCCRTVLPRFLAVIEIIRKGEPLFDVLLDTTEMRANPSALLFVRRSALKVHHESALTLLAKQFGAKLIV